MSAANRNASRTPELCVGYEPAAARSLRLDEDVDAPGEARLRLRRRAIWTDRITLAPPIDGSNFDIVTALRSIPCHSLRRLVGNLLATT
jgi:hypothetical protein